LPPIIESLTGIKLEKLLEQVPSPKSAMTPAVTPVITDIKPREKL
jgi:hypothetical protein